METTDDTGVFKGTLSIIKVPLLAKSAVRASHKYRLDKMYVFQFKDPLVELYHGRRYQGRS